MTRDATSAASERPNVRLRLAGRDDLPVFYDNQLDGEATAMAAFPARDWDAFLTHWRRILRDETVVVRTILADDDVAGNIVSFEHGGEREVGYWLGREFWGKGIATQALRQFLVILRMRPLYARAAAHNAASLRVLEKCGFTRVGQGRLIPGGGREDGVDEIVLVIQE